MGKRRTQWIGGGQNIEPETDASTIPAELIQLLPPLQTATIAGLPSKVVVEAIYLNFSVHRLLTAEVDALGFLVWVANRQENSNLPVQALDALSLIDTSYANPHIMMMAPLPVPPVTHSSDLGAVAADLRVDVAHHEFQANRGVDRAQEMVVMSVNCDVSVVLSVFCQWRMLLAYYG